MSRVKDLNAIINKLWWASGALIIAFMLIGASWLALIPVATLLAANICGTVLRMRYGWKDPETHEHLPVFFW